MAAGTQDAAGQYVWEAAGKSVVVCVHLDVIDRMLAEVMRGFSAVPKRGAEVGGVLIGTVERAGDQSIVRVQDFEAVDCEYKRGPSYLFVDRDYGQLQEAARRWQPDESRRVYAVGFFRSHTRDGMSLTDEDIALIEECFPSPEQVALLIKPSATRVSTAGFFFREEGAFQDTTPLEFPFRRRELTGEDAPPRLSVEHRGLERRSRRAREDRTAQVPEPAEAYAAPERLAPLQPEPAYPARPAKSRLRSIIWIPLSFVFLLLGVALGFMIGLTRGPGQNGVDEYALGLVVTADSGGTADKSKEPGYNLSLKWDRLARPVRAAQRGVLEIEDGKYTKSVDLDTAQLSNGGIIYKNLTSTVRFRLTVYPRSQVGVTETADWKK